MHNRVKAYLDLEPLPGVYRSKCDCLSFLRGEYLEELQQERAEAVTVWQPAPNLPAFAVSPSVFNLKGGKR